MNYLETWNGRKLLETYPMHEYGIWRVQGEDPNCDLVGYHHHPDLGTYEGKLVDVLTLAEQLPGFWSWGAGGVITKLNVTKMDETSAAERAQKRHELKELENRMAVLKKELSLN